MTRPDIDDPSMPLQVLFVRCPAASEAFLARRMLCLGCPVAPFHTVLDACVAYQLDEAAFRRELHAAMAVWLA